MPATQLLLFDPPRPLEERFGEEFFRAIPERPGVYFLCGESSVLYVGKAVNLRRRLGNYRAAHPERHSRKIFRLLFQVTRIYWDECADDTAASERERQLLLVLQPKFNTAGVYPKPRALLGPVLAPPTATPPAFPTAHPDAKVRRDGQ